MTITMLLGARLLLIATSISFAFASTKSLWTEFNDNELGHVVGANRRALLILTSRTFESDRHFYGSLERLHQDQQLQTKVIMIDCDVEVKICRQFDVNEYPAIRLYQRGKAEEGLIGEETTLIRYRGRRTEHAIRSFLIKQEYDFLYAIEDYKELGEFKKVDDVVIIAHLSDEWTEIERIFRFIAKKLHTKFVFGYIKDREIAEAEGFAIPTIVCYKNNDGNHKILEGTFTEEDLWAFLATAPEMVIGDFNDRNMEAYMIVSQQAPSYLRWHTSDLSSRESFLPTSSPPRKKKLRPCVTSSRPSQKSTSSMLRSALRIRQSTRLWRRILDLQTGFQRSLYTRL